MKKITDPNLLKELYDIEADWKLLIGYRFKGSLGPLRHAVGKIRVRVSKSHRPAGKQ